MKYFVLSCWTFILIRIEVGSSECERNEFVSCSLLFCFDVVFRSVMIDSLVGRPVVQGIIQDVIAGLVWVW